MAKKVKLAILRAYHDLKNPPGAPQAWIDMLMANEKRTSVLNYWTDNTQGYLDFVDSVMFPWVKISMSADDISRETQAKRAYEATKKLNGDKELDGFDGFVVLTMPGQLVVPNPKAGKPKEPDTILLGFDKGAGPTLNGSPTCIIPVLLADHTFICHEVGHILGFGHTYGVWNNGVDWDGKPPYDQGQVYGDPYDIMSSATFGSRISVPGVSGYRGDPQFSETPTSGWPLPPGVTQVKMGPAPALAHVHQWHPDVFPPNSVVHFDTPGGDEYDVRIYAANRQDESPRLAVVHPPIEDEDGRYRCYIEYREPSGWDKGLDDSGGDLARRAVVVHTLSDAYLDGIRCWYQGRILVPVEIDSDLEVYGTPLVVRVTNEDVAAGFVDVKITTVNPRGVEIRVTGEDTERELLDPIKGTTPCGESVTSATWRMQSIYTYRPITYGYGGEGAPDASPPQITWTIGALTIPTGSSTLKVPTSTGSFDIGYTLDPVTAELTLTSEIGDRYRVNIKATATESDGSNPVSKDVMFAPPGVYKGFRPGDLHVLNNCIGKFLQKVKIDPHDLLVPPGPNPFQVNMNDKINQFRLNKVIKTIAPSHPVEAAALKAVVAMRFGYM
ncbi:MAG: hypothetical protein WAM60_14625 [Candidatus Promineifilaceae bacterium]